MPSILDRLRAALRPEYEVERELASGGMGIVFLARDVVLDRRVAIKILRPELATADAVEQFLREARLLANLSHPDVVPVHRAGEADGLPYYVMDYIEEDTLAARLRAGPLSHGAVLKLGRDLLDALEAVHRLGIVHRDIKPANIFLVNGRALLGDFGIASPQLTHTDEPPIGRPRGTLGYMAPEQLFGWSLSPRTDLYAVAIVLYEAYTGRRWTTVLPDERPDWSGVPRIVRPILRRALAWDPATRWPDAASFRHRLWRTRTLKYLLRTAVIAGVGAAAAVALVREIVKQRAVPRATIAVLPFETGFGVGNGLADNLSRLTLEHLHLFTRVAPATDVAAWRAQHRGALDSLAREAADALRAEHVVWARVTAGGGDTAIALNLVDARGRRTSLGTHHLSSGQAQLAHRLGLAIARHIAPNEWPDYKGNPWLIASDSAALAFVAGRRAFERNAFRSADAHFMRALRLDATFGQAEWWASNAWRWLATGYPHPDIDLARVLRVHGHELPDLDSMLIEAQLMPDPRRRFAIYEDAIARYPHDGYTRFLYAAESQDRGPLIGISLETIAERLEAAARVDSSFGPTFGHLVWTYVRLGKRDHAEATLERYWTLSADPRELDVNQPALLEFVVTERFFPERAAAAREALLTDPVFAVEAARAFRLAAMFGLYRTQLELAQVFAADPRLAEHGAGNLHEAQGLSLVALGRTAEALAQFDTAAALLGSATARAEAAEWRVVGAALGLPGIAADEREAGRRKLRELAGPGTLGLRVAWALGWDAVASGRLTDAARWRETLRAAEPDTIARRLGALLDAAERHARGRHAEADVLFRALLPHDSAGRAGDPFARAALHLIWAAALDSLRRPAAADSARRWYEHFELGVAEGLPSREAQVGEVDWALAPLAAWQRGVAAEHRGDRRAACRHYARLPDLWARADAAYQALRDGAARYLGRRCGR